MGEKNCGNLGGFWRLETLHADLIATQEGEEKENSPSANSYLPLHCGEVYNI